MHEFYYTSKCSQIVDSHRIIIIKKIAGGAHYRADWFYFYPH